jgi:glutathione-dependent peroxiredoxin
MDWVIHTKPGCPHCDRAKALLSDADFTWTEQVYETPEQIAAFKARGLLTFPQIYLDGALVGGADALALFLPEITTF